jgi:hypothetical protein
MQYTVAHTNSFHFELTGDDGIPAGMLDYAVWLPSRAHITTAAGIVYEITTAGFWQTTRIITRAGVPFATLKADYNRGIYLDFENGLSLYFKRKSFWVSNEYVLINGDGNEIAAVQSFFAWNNFSFSYVYILQK